MSHPFDFFASKTLKNNRIEKAARHRGDYETSRGALDEKSFSDAFEHGQILDLSQAVALARRDAAEIPTGGEYRSDEPFSEIVIENRSFSRIIIEGEIEESTEPDAVTGKIIDITPAPQRKNNLRGWVEKYWMTATVALLALAAVGGIYFW